MSDRKERIARNEALFRDLNERTKEITESLTPGDPPRVLEIFCECGQADCVMKLLVSTNVYETVRAHSEQFLLADGHDIPDVEHVVERTDDYLIVAKEAEAVQIARETDPRD
jgi:hypothetical protein